MRVTKAKLGLAIAAVGLSLFFFMLAYSSPPPAFVPPHHKITLSDYAYQTFVLAPKLLAYEFLVPVVTFRTYAELSVSFLVLAVLAVLSTVSLERVSRFLDRKVKLPRMSSLPLAIMVAAGLFIYAAYQSVNVLYTFIGTYQGLPWFMREYLRPLIIDPTTQGFTPNFGIYAFTGFAVASAGVFVWGLRGGVWTSAKKTVCLFCAPLMVAPPLLFFLGGLVPVESDHVTRFLITSIPFPGATAWAPVYLFSNWTVLAVSLFFMASGLASVLKGSDGVDVLKMMGLD